MDGTPKPPRRSAPEFNAAEVGHSRLSPNRRKATAMTVSEWGWQGAPAQTRADNLGNVAPLLFCRGRQPWDRLAVPGCRECCVADGIYVSHTSDSKVGFDDDP